MMPMTKLRAFLDEEKVRYVSIRHSEAFTALEIAASAHISGKEMVKTVMIKVDGKMAMAVLPANEKVDLAKLREMTAADSVEIATELEFGDLFPGCELGAMPPFGNLWGMRVFAAPSLGTHDKIAFNAGSHTELLKMDYTDFERLVKPEVAEFSTAP